MNIKFQIQSTRYYDNKKVYFNYIIYKENCINQIYLYDSTMPLNVFHEYHSYIDSLRETRMIIKALKKEILSDRIPNRSFNIKVIKNGN